jgi:hypothetical protein
MRLVRFALVAIGILYAHHAFSQSRTWNAIVQQTTPGQWVVINPDGSSHIVIYNPQSGLYQDNLVNSGSQQDPVTWPSNCGTDPQTGGFYCQ